MQNSNMTPNVTNKRNMIISGAVVLVVLVALFVAPKLVKEPETEVASNTEEVTTGNTEPQKALSRAEATEKYAGKTIRFSGDCQASPEVFDTSAGVTIMIDNDTDARRAIMIGQKSYSVGAHRYTLSSMNMGVGEHAVSCDGAVVSKIVIK